MKLEEAFAIINRDDGFYVRFDKAVGACLHDDKFPSRLDGEKGFATFDEADGYARKFASACQSHFLPYWNISVSCGAYGRTEFRVYRPWVGPFVEGP